MLKRFVVALVALLVAGCAAAPGMYLDDDKFTRPDDDALKAQQQIEYKVKVITSQLMLEMQEQKAREKPGQEQIPAQDIGKYEYRVGTNDILSIIVWDHPELTNPAGEFRQADVVGHLVNEDGNIFYPYVGRLHVADQTVGEIREVLINKLSHYIQNPQLDVRVAAFRNKQVYVTGEVNTPSVLPITDRPLTVLEAINMSGGPTKEADLQSVVISHGDKVRTLDVEALNLGARRRNDILRDGEQVYVPDQYQNQVYLLGEVAKPSMQLMHKGKMSLAEAIGRVEGFDPLAADASRVYVIRGELAKPQIYQLNANAPDALLLATTFELKPKDVVYVSTATISRWNRLMTQIVPTLSAIYQTDTMINRH